MPRKKLTMKELKQSPTSGTVIRCIEAHEISYIDKRGSKKKQVFKKGLLKRRLQIKLLRPTKWEVPA